MRSFSAIKPRNIIADFRNLQIFGNHLAWCSRLYTRKRSPPANRRNAFVSPRQCGIPWSQIPSIDEDMLQLRQGLRSLTFATFGVPLWSCRSIQVTYLLVNIRVWCSRWLPSKAFRFQKAVAFLNWRESVSGYTRKSMTDFPNFRNQHPSRHSKHRTWSWRMFYVWMSSLNHPTKYDSSSN